MGKRYLSAAVLLASVAGLPAASNAQVRIYEQDGVTYQETRRMVPRSVYTTHYEERPQTVYRSQLRSDLADTYRTYSAPVTQYEWMTRVHGRWNPFVVPYITQELVPITRWEYRTEAVQVPVARTEWVAEQRMVRVPITTHRVAQEEVITRVALGASGAGASIGGVARLESDPPRQGNLSQPASGAVRLQ